MQEVVLLLNKWKNLSDFYNTLMLLLVKRFESFLLQVVLSKDC